MLSADEDHQTEESQLYHPEDAEQYLLQATDGQHTFTQVMPS
jgi:hypothetical protein